MWDDDELRDLRARATPLGADVIENRLGNLLSASEGPDAVIDSPVLDVASLRSSWTLSELDHFVRGAHPEPDWERAVLKRSVQFGGPESDAWTVKDHERRTHIRSLGRDGVARILGSISPEEVAQDPHLDFLNRALRSEPFSLEEMSAPRLSELLSLTELAEGVIPGLPERAAVAREIARLRLLEPMRRLVSTTFSGREDVLAELEDYVGEIPSRNWRSTVRRLGQQLWYSLSERPPLMLYGPGGVGKSTTISKFILDHVDSDELDLSFVYLDIYRPSLVPTEPMTLLQEAARQIGLQHPSVAPAAEELSHDISEAREQVDGLEVTKMVVDDSMIVRRFASLLDSLPPPNDQAPVLFVIDTFEEAQRIGRDVESIIWSFLVNLQELAPRLRIVLAGRVKPEELPVKAVLLSGFDQASARSYLERCLQEAAIEGLPRGFGDAVIDRVGTNPLVLKVSAELVAQVGTKALEGVHTRGRLLRRLEAEKIEAEVYGRYLQNLGDEELERIAFPGLALRRLTPEVIAHVLAGPCALGEVSEERAQSLFDRMERRIFIVERDPLDGSLRHRPDVRRLMLHRITDLWPGVESEINGYAISFYENSDDDVSRGEEIYHLLRRGETERAKQRWRPGLEGRLADAFDDLSPHARVVLGELLGRTFDEDDLRAADQDEWEKATELRAREFLRNREPKKALKALSARRDRLLGSRLHLTEAEAQRMAGRPERALESLERGLASASAHPGLAIELLLMKSLVLESQSQQQEALTAAEEAFELAGKLDDRTEALRAALALLRLSRADATTEDTTALVARAVALARAQLYALAQRPALLREVAAELGVAAPDLLRLAIEKLGLQADEPTAQRVAEAFAEWEKEQQQADSPDPAASRLQNLVNPNAPNRKAAWVELLTRGAGSSVQAVILEALTGAVASGLGAALSLTFRAAVDIAVQSQWGSDSKR